MLTQPFSRLFVTRLRLLHCVERPQPLRDSQNYLKGKKTVVEKQKKRHQKLLLKPDFHSRISLVPVKLEKHIKPQIFAIDQWNCRI